MLLRSCFALFFEPRVRRALAGPGRLLSLHHGLSARGVRGAPREGLRGHRQGRVAVVQGAPIPPSYTRFRQTNEFYYLCGIEVPHAYLIIDGKARRHALSAPPQREARAGRGQDALGGGCRRGQEALGRRRRRRDRPPRRTAWRASTAARNGHPLHAARAGRRRLDEPRPRAALRRRHRRRIPSTGGPRARAASPSSSAALPRLRDQETSRPRSTSCG